MNEDADKGSERRIRLRLVQILLMLVVVLLLGAHITKWDVVQIDAVTLTLLGFLCLIPFTDLIRKIKLGEFEAEIGKDEIAKAQAKVAMELPPLAEADPPASEARIRELLREDPRLALAKVRIELEEAIKRLYFVAPAESAIDPRRISLSRMVDSLTRREVITGSLASAVRDVISLANRAVHGERVEASAAKELGILGVQLVHEIRQLHVDRLLQPVERRLITPEEVSSYDAARFKVTTIVPIVDKPYRNTYLFDQAALESFLEGYEEYAEFIVAVERV